MPSAVILDALCSSARRRRASQVSRALTAASPKSTAPSGDAFVAGS
jgi:hypothetical protein